MKFHPAPATEKGQVKIFCGAETLESRFDTAYLRMNPSDFESFISASQTHAAARWTRATSGAREEVFREESPKSFVLDLGDLSREPWSLLPGAGRLSGRDAHAPLRHADLREIRHRSRRHHALRPQAPPQHRALRVEGEARAARPFYNEDDLVDYDVLDYDIDVRATPGSRMDRRARALRLKIRSTGSAR